MDTQAMRKIPPIMQVACHTGRVLLERGYASRRLLHSAAQIQSSISIRQCLSVNSPSAPVHQVHRIGFPWSGIEDLTDLTSLHADRGPLDVDGVVGRTQDCW